MLFASSSLLFFKWQSSKSANYLPIMLSLFGAMTLYCCRNTSSPHYPPCVYDTYGPELKRSLLLQILWLFSPFTEQNTNAVGAVSLGQCLSFGTCITTFRGFY